MDNEVRERLGRRIDQLPVLPNVIGQLMVLDRSDDDYFENVLGLIEADPTFAARMLSAANAIASSPRSPITTVRAALARLGSVGASNLILAMAVSRVFIPRDAWEKSLWRHAVQVAVAVRALVEVAGERCQITPDEAYTAGLLHDVGRFVMFEEAPDELRQIDEGDWDTPEALIEMEQRICGLSHGKLGWMACKRWGLPELLCELVLRHHEPSVAAPASPLEALHAAVHFADLAMFPAAMPGTPGFDEAPLEVIKGELVPKLPDIFDVSAEELHALIKRTMAEANATCDALGLA